MNPISANTFIPMPVCLAGTIVEDRVNFMAVGWVSRVNYSPPLIGISLGKTHYTCRGIITHKQFSLAFPSSKDRIKVDYCGMTPGEKISKEIVFKTEKGVLENAPLIPEFPLNFECELKQTLDFSTNYFFVGEIKAAYCDEKYLNENGEPALDKMDLFFLTMPDNKYWKAGACIGNAWKDGKEYHP